VCVYARRPRRTLRSHDCQRAPRKLSVHAVVLCASCTPLYCPGAPAKSVQSSYLTLSGCVLLSQGGPGVRLARHRRRRQELRRQRCTARRIGGCDKLCDDNDAQHDRFSHGRRGRDVRYARTIINAHHVSLACMQSPCARLVRIMSPTILPRRYARRPRRTLRSHDCQRASRKLSVHAVVFCAHVS